MGTIEKLGLTGVLFHHETPTHDFIHLWMKPYVHYIPIKDDLSDLKEKFDWAESNQNKARAISEAATNLAKKLGTLKGMDELFHDIFEDPLRKVIEAYEPLPEGSTSWQDVVKSKKVSSHSCQRDKKVHCFWSSNPMDSTYAKTHCLEKDVERPDSVTLGFKSAPRIVSCSKK